ncbi:MAG: Protein-export membrane protein SecG [Spirochaetes bacterium ADurb.Bin315]|jgi:preprotein translocase subunit SecG|nr:preprotein translocase subunit SecG [Spirochaetota bacterium]NLL25320.1 preprotein translocase subunit SecG [Spirochaetales bacterium]OQA44573.1 MAG: Protein-export membrane protein SecG [Spirochaetes bacterium ADurb.Bin315]HOE89015.1 preprotein translocase subunit SecG [Sphaerochaeta sp.]HOR79990.1 preprotein translocase subunit SecG [Sphaerochaeta sp.]
MGVLSVIILILFIIVSLLLIFLVAIQDEQSEGLGGIFGGGSQTAFGSQTSSVVTKATGILAALFLVLALLVAFINKTPSQDRLLDSVTTEQVQQTTEWWDAGN